MTFRPGEWLRRYPGAIAAILAAAVWTTLASLSAVRPSRLGLPACPETAERDLLSHDALECWFDEDETRWRILSVVSAHRALVVRVEVADGRMSSELARRFVERAQQDFGEVLLYVYPPGSSGSRLVRRLQWTREGGYAELEFRAP
jgi:hypothetical protein